MKIPKKGEERKQMKKDNNLQKNDFRHKSINEIVSEGTNGNYCERKKTETVEDIVFK